MKKFVIKDSFGFDNLVQVEEDTPAPGPGEALVKMKAAALNYRDLLMVGGAYNPNQKLPLVPLSDGCGIVEEAGEGVSRVKKGGRVCTTFFRDWIKGTPTHDELRSTLGGPFDGALTEYMVLPERALVVPPKHLTDEEAATLPCAAVTAWTALVSLGSIKAGDTVLTLGSGGVSVFALQFARMNGARVIATSSSDDKRKKLEELGAFATINYKETPDWGKKARELSGGAGVDHVIEVGGSGTLEQSLKAMKVRGTVSLIGVLSGAAGDVQLRLIFMNGVRVQGIFVGPRDSFEDMCRAISASEMRPLVDRVFPFDDAAEAMKYMKRGKHLGKVVISVP